MGISSYVWNEVLFFIKSVEMYCTVFFIIIVGSLFSHILKFPFPERTGFLFEEECWRSGDFSMDYFTMFAVCASYCVSTSPLALASSVCSVAQPHPERHDQATQRILTAYIWIEAHYFFWERRTPPSAHTQSPGHSGAQTDINSGCKAFASSVVAIVHFVFVLCEATACDDAFFFILGLF